LKGQTVELKQITQEEWDAYEWIDTGEGYFIRGVKKTSQPDFPDDGMKYFLVETTTFSDSERQYKIVPAMRPA
jgi:hypothetical protein